MRRLTPRTKSPITRPGAARLAAPPEVGLGVGVMVADSEVLVGGTWLVMVAKVVEVVTLRVSEVMTEELKP